jgi:hypothetical protein
MDSSALSALAAAIKTQEGWYPGSLSFRNNNPGNLRYVGQAGAVPGEGGFAKFPSEAAGDAALQNQIVLDASRGTDAAGRPVVTVADLIESWAPSSENDTGAYISSVVTQTGFPADASLNDLGSGSSLALPDLPSEAGLLEVFAGGVPDLTTVVVGLSVAALGWLLFRIA